MNIRTFAATLSLCALSVGQSWAAQTIRMQVDGLVCAFCGSAIEKKLRSNAATDDVLVSLEHRIVALSLKDGQDLADDVLRKQITDAGYLVKSIERVPDTLDSLRAGLKAR